MDIGLLGEQIAEHYLKSLGHRIIAKRWRSGHLEIDLVSDDSLILHIVEVKSRCRSYGNFTDDFSPVAAMTASKLEKIGRAAELYCVSQKVDREISIDLLTVNFTSQDIVVRYFEAVNVGKL